jgi:hypothetical protein
MAAYLCQCDRCHRVYLIGAIEPPRCPACRAQCSQTVITRLEREVL